MALETVDVASAAPGHLDPAHHSVTVRGRPIAVIDLLAATVIAVGSGMQAWALRNVGLTFDDVRLQSSTARRSLSAVLGDPAALSDPAALGDPPTHPGVPDLGGVLTRAAVGLVARTAPLRDLPVLAAGIALRALLATALWLLLRRLLRPSAALLLPLAVVVVSPALLGAGVGMVAVFGPLAAVTALTWAAVALVSWSGGRQAAAVAVTTAVAVGTDRVGIIAPVALVALALTFPGPRSAGRSTWWRPVASQSAALAVCSVVVLVALAVPALRPTDLEDLNALPAPDDVLAALRAVFGGLVGAPWHWSAPVSALPEVTVTAAVPAAVAVGAVLAVAVRRAPWQALRAVGLCAVWGLGTTFLGLPHRAAPSAALLGVTLAVVTAAALAVLAETPPTQTPLTQTPPTQTPPDRITGPQRPTPASAVPPAVLPLVLPLAAVLLAVPSTSSYALATGSNPLRTWLGEVRTTLDGLRPFPRIVARAVPSDVYGRPGTAPFDSDVVTLLRPDALVHDADGPQQSLDDSGRLVPARIQRLGGGKRAKLCVASVQPGQAGDARVPLVKPVSLTPSAQVRLEVLITGTTRLQVAVEGSDGRADPVRQWSDDLLYEGPHTVMFPVSAATQATAIRLRPSAPEAAVCVIVADVVQAL